MDSISGMFGRAGSSGAISEAASSPAAGAGMGTLGSAGAGAGAGFNMASILPTIMKAAPLVMTAGSLITKDKTMKDLLGVGSLISQGANLVMSPKGKSTGATNPVAGTVGTGGVAANASQNAMRFQDLYPYMMMSSKLGEMVGARNPNTFTMPPPGPNLINNQNQGPIIPRATVPAYSPMKSTMAANAPYQRFLQTMQSQGY